MANNVNDKFNEWKTNGKIEQVPSGMFGAQEDYDDTDDVPDAAGKPEDAMAKASFSELRYGRKVPRLKKSMVLTIITGGIFVFLFLVNVFIQKKDEQKKYFDEQKNNVSTGGDFSLGDLEKRRRQPGEDYGETIQGDEWYFKPPPAYAPLGEHKTASVSSGGGSNPPASRPPSPSYSDGDLLAMKARIGKEGGYGLTVMTAAANTAYTMPAGTDTHLFSREEYTRQSMDDLAKLVQMTSGGGTGSAQGRDNTRYTEAGKYEAHNSPQGLNVSYLNDECLFPGTIIHAILVSAIDTDYPGPIHARVTENVYDSMTGKKLLIPQGTILQGHYSSSSIGVAKVQIAWESMVINYDGLAYQTALGGMAGVDKRGRAGIAGTLDDHYFEWLKAAGIISLFSMLNSEVMYWTKSQTSSQVRELMDINQGIVNKIGDRLIERAIDIQPTVRVANGTAVSVSVNTVVHLRPLPPINAEEKWIRK